jgi:hypothetical protein
VIPTVPQPISRLVPPSTEPDINNERFGFRPQPPAKGLHKTAADPALSGFSKPPGNPFIAAGPPPIVPAPQAGDWMAVIDPVLLVNPPRSSFQPSPRSHHSSSFHGPPLRQHYVDTFSTQLTTATHTNEHADLESRGDDAENESNEDSPEEYEPGLSGSSGEDEQVPLGNSTTHAHPNHDHCDVNNVYYDDHNSHDDNNLTRDPQDYGFNGSTINHDPDDPLLRMSMFLLTFSES